MPELDVVVDADTRGLAGGMDVAEKRFGGLGSIATKAGLAVAAGLATAGAAVIKLGIDAIGAASDLNETLSKSKVIFGESADEIEDWGDTAAKNLGLSKAAAIEAATGFGNMFTQLGQGPKAAADTSQAVVQLAADLGSFNNIPTAEVSDKISAAFRGEYDSIQALIPNINAARVEKEALAATGKETADQLTAEEKAMAALSIITQDGAAAQGDFARTSDGLANQQKILGAQFEDVKAKLGQKLLPVAAEFVGFLNDEFLPGAEDLARFLAEKLGPTFTRVGGFISDDLVPAAKDLLHWFVDEIVPGLQKYAVPVLDSLQDAFKLLAQKLEDNGPELQQLLDLFKEVAEFIAQHVMPILGDLVALGVGQFADFIGRAIDGLGLLIGAFSDVVDMVKSLIDWISKIDFPDIPDINPFGRSVFDGGGGGFGGFGGGKAQGPLLGEPVQLVYQFTINGAVDPVSSARQIRRILDDADALNGAPNWSTL